MKKDNTVTEKNTQQCQGLLKIKNKTSREKALNGAGFS